MNYFFGKKEPEIIDRSDYNLQSFSMKLRNASGLAWWELPKLDGNYYKNTEYPKYNLVIKVYKGNVQEGNYTATPAKTITINSTNMVNYKDTNRQVPFSDSSTYVLNITGLTNLVEYSATAEVIYENPELTSEVLKTSSGFTSKYHSGAIIKKDGTVVEAYKQKRAESDTYAVYISKGETNTAPAIGVPVEILPDLGYGTEDCVMASSGKSGISIAPKSNRITTLEGNTDGSTFLKKYVEFYKNNTTVYDTSTNDIKESLNYAGSQYRGYFYVRDYGKQFTGSAISKGWFLPSYSEMIELGIPHYTYTYTSTVPPSSECSSTKNIYCTSSDGAKVFESEYKSSSKWDQYYDQRLQVAIKLSSK